MFVEFLGDGFCVNFKMRWEQGNFLVNRMPGVLCVSSELFRQGQGVFSFGFCFCFFSEGDLQQYL